MRVTSGEDPVAQQRDDRTLIVPDLSPDPGGALDQRGARDAFGLVGGVGLDGVAVVPGELAGQAARVLDSTGVNGLAAMLAAA